MGSLGESSASAELGGEELGEEEKMARFFELIRGMREARIRMAMLRGIQGGESEITTARQSKRRKAGGGNGQGGGGRPWVPKFEADDFGMDGTGDGGAGCSFQGASGKAEGGEKLEDDVQCGLSLKLTL
ncbi:hypothetical protein MLD38_032961 [Melastoma candidum]|uniref:Uncharacterized protein n=1 Tax=Melastoma candidum TaxID=119954 RepID=A0ACB9M5T8_9MYRT|nr:hypothetical protein MLD38_032961 [Melastoma candidum]